MDESVETVETPQPAVQAVVGAEAAGTQTDSGLVLEDLLVEDVSIDGMCGVY